MENVRILINMPVDEDKLNELKAVPGTEVILIPNPAEEERELPAELIGDCEMFFTTFLPLNHKDMRKPKMVQISSAGYNQLFNRDLNERQIKCCNALGVQDIPIAEWNIAMMVNLQRDMRSMMINQTHKVWDRSSRYQSEISGKTMGIWGYGGIGRQTARLAKAMGLKVQVMTPDGKIKRRDNIYCVPGAGDKEGIFADKIFSVEQKKQFLCDLDFLVLAIPLTPTTKGIIGEAEIGMLPRKAFVLNPARGPLIQEQPLIDALKNHSIAGAGLDTHYYYPMPPEHPFWTMDNVILTPHISGSNGSTRFLERIWDIWVQNVESYMAGKPLLNELTEAQIGMNKT